MKIVPTFRLALALFATALTCPAQSTNGLKGAVVLIIRHAEKPESGMELSPAGTQRAEAYAKYFKEYQVDAKPLKLDSLIATADSKGSHRPRLTLEPLSKALGLPVKARFKDKETAMLAEELKASPHGKAILICWHHGGIPDLLRSLGADPEALLPNGRWPAQEFAWVIQLRYDSEGRLQADQCHRINEHLMPRDPAR